MYIYSNRDTFWQWDTNQKISSRDLKIGDILHFYNAKQPNALPLKAYEFEGKVVVDVPNILLQNATPVQVYRWVDDGTETYTIEEFSFEVKQRPRPGDYVYTETEVLTFQDLDDRIKTLEEGSGTVKSVNDVTPDETGNVAIEIPKVEVDPTLTVEGSAADAKAVGDALAEKALKTLYVEPTDIGGESNGQPTLFPVKIANHTVEEIKAWFQNGGNVKLSYWGLVLDLKSCNGVYANFESTSLDNTGGGGTQLVISKATIHPNGSIFVYYPERLGYIRSNFSATVGQTIVVDAVDEHDIPTAWKVVDMPKAITIDPTLSIEGQAADAKAVSDALADKAKKPLIINADDAPTTGSNSVSGIPIFTIDYSPADLKAYADAGGSVTIVRYNRHYAMYDATEETAKFRFIEATDMQVDWYYAVLDANRNVTITKTTHKSRMETTTGGAVGQIPIIKSLDSKGCPSTWEFGDIPKAVAVPDAVGATPTAEEFNALLTALRNAGLMAAE